MEATPCSDTVCWHQNNDAKMDLGGRSPGSVPTIRILAVSRSQNVGSTWEHRSRSASPKKRAPRLHPRVDVAPGSPSQRVPPTSVPQTEAPPEDEFQDVSEHFRAALRTTPCSKPHPLDREWAGRTGAEHSLRPRFRRLAGSRVAHPHCSNGPYYDSITSSLSAGCCGGHRNEMRGRREPDLAVGRRRRRGSNGG